MRISLIFVPDGAGTIAQLDPDLLRFTVSLKYQIISYRFGSFICFYKLTTNFQNPVSSLLDRIIPLRLKGARYSNRSAD